jgi:hypothetical protein
MTQDILKQHPETDMDPAYYATLLTECQQQLAASVAAERRHETIAKTMLDKQQGLELAMIAAWDNVEQFALLKAEYEGLQVVFNLAPKAYAYHQKRSNAIRQHEITIKSVRDKATVAARYEREAAKAEAARIESERVAAAEREQRQAAAKAERDLELAEQHARNAALYERVEADKADSLAWLKRLTGTHSHE